MPATSEFDIARLRATRHEQLRVEDLMSLSPRGGRVLEIGARDCHISHLLTSLYAEVVALDLVCPQVAHSQIIPIQGDVTRLDFEDNSFDTVFCTEVLEHIDPALLQQACNEIARVARRYAVVGVPFRQDLRAGRMRCNHCGGINPTTGHRTAFDQQKLETLFKNTMRPMQVRLVGSGAAAANSLSTLLFSVCGYPYGTYEQEEACIHCNQKMSRPRINFLRWCVCFVARGLVFAQTRWRKVRGKTRHIWIHILFEKHPSS